MLRILQGEWSRGWKPYLWDKALRLAKEEPAIYGELPRLLTEAMERKAIKEGANA